MNIEEQILPIVPFGKYKDKSVLELLADEKYVEWLKQQSWFSNQKQIYNIVVHQTIHTTNNSKTPEHNKLQNLFLDTRNQQKLLSKLFKNDLIDGINNLFKEADIIRLFGENIIPEFINNLDKTTINFEDKFNWDLVLYYKDTQGFTITSKLETELFDKIRYKEQYDIEQNEKYVNNLLSFDMLIEYRIKLDQEGNQKCINKYDETMKEYKNDLNKYNETMKKYENDLNFYLQQKPQNAKDIENYEKELKIYENLRDKFITYQTKLICQELGINYDNFVKWKVTDKYYSPYTDYDHDHKHTKEEKIQLHEIVHYKLNPFINEFKIINKTPTFVGNLNIPTKPQSRPPHPCHKGYSFNEDIYISHEDSEYKLVENVQKIKYINSIGSVCTLNKYKKDYENEYKKDYENNFNKHYENYRLQYYRDIIKKYFNKNVHVQKTNENQYEISIKICCYNYAVCCELKPTLSDDYPTVLRKLKTQIELTQNDKNKFKDLNKKIILIIGSFTSIHVSKEQLITIFNQSNIKVIFTDEIFETSKSVAIKYVNTNTTAEQSLVEENKILTDNLLQTQQTLLQAKEKIKQLEEEILSLKSQKQSKSIKNYFGKK